MRLVQTSDGHNVNNSLDYYADEEREESDGENDVRDVSIDCSGGDGRQDKVHEKDIGVECSGGDGLQDGDQGKDGGAAIGNGEDEANRDVNGDSGRWADDKGYNANDEDNL
jgi:hypothetical protein